MTDGHVVGSFGRRVDVSNRSATSQISGDGFGFPRSRREAFQSVNSRKAIDWGIRGKPPGPDRARLQTFSTIHERSRRKNYISAVCSSRTSPRRRGCVSPNPMAQSPARLKLVGILMKNLPFTIQSAPLTRAVARLRSLLGGQSVGGRGGPGCENSQGI